MLYVLLWAGPYIYVDINMPESNGAYFLLSFVGIGLNFFLLYSLTQSSDARGEKTHTGIIAYFGLSILHSVAISIGLILLILPGLYLALRWLPAFARLLKSHEGVVEALGWSWDRTKGHELALGLPFLGMTSIYLLGVGPIVGWEYLYNLTDYVSYETIDSLYIPSVVLTNIALALGLAWYTILGVACYSCLRDDVWGETAAFE